MSTVLDTGLDAERMASVREWDQKLLRRAVDKIEPPPVLSRDDQIIAAGHAKRKAFRTDNPGAAWLDGTSEQIGYLHGEIRRLCNELQRYADTVSPGLDRMDVETSIGTVVVGYAYLPEDEDGGSSQVEVREVWVNGVDLHAWVPGDELDRIADEVLAKHEADEAEKAARSMCRADERGAA